METHRFFFEANIWLICVYIFSLFHQKVKYHTCRENKQTEVLRPFSSKNACIKSEIWELLSLILLIVNIWLFYVLVDFHCLKITLELVFLSYFFHSSFNSHTMATQNENDESNTSIKAMLWTFVTFFWLQIFTICLSFYHNRWMGNPSIENYIDHTYMFKWYAICVILIYLKWIGEQNQTCLVY